MVLLEVMEDMAVEYSPGEILAAINACGKGESIDHEDIALLRDILSVDFGSAVSRGDIHRAERLARLSTKLVTIETDYRTFETDYRG